MYQTSSSLIPSEINVQIQATIFVLLACTSMSNFDLQTHSPFKCPSDNMAANQTADAFKTGMD